MFKKVIVGSAFILMSATALAAPAGFYGGLDIGSTSVDDLDSSKVSYGIYGGYGFNQYFATELGYRHLGKWDLYGLGVSVRQTHLSLVGSYPLTQQLDLYGRLGYNNLRGEVRYGGVIYGAESSGGLYGIGLGYRFGQNLFGRAEVQKPSSDSTNYGVSLSWQF